MISLRLGVEEKKKTEQMREEWIANISHDLKTPLSSIKGYSEMLADEDYSFSQGETRYYAGVILDKTVYLADLIEDLRLNQQLQGKSLSMLRKRRNLTLFMRQVIIEILNHPNYSTRSLTFEASNEIILFNFDERLLKRSLVNLVMNALIHNPPETEIMISLEEEKEEIILIIEDTGRGMSETDLEKLFNRYYRGTNTTDFQGSGLGMAIAKELIEAHQGTLDVESQVNQGTKITITFS